MYAVLDCETTGFDVDNNEIIELSIIQTDRGFNPVRTFNSLVKPTHVNVKQTDIHGLTDKDVSSAPTFDEIVFEVADMLEGQVLIAHNIDFDQQHLEKAFRGSRLSSYYSYTFGIGICTKTIAQRVGHHKAGLNSLADHYRLSRKGTAHTAMSDAEMTLQVAKRMYHDFPEEFEGHPFRSQLKRKMKRKMSEQATPANLAAVIMNPHVQSLQKPRSGYAADALTTAIETALSYR